VTEARAVLVARPGHVLAARLGALVVARQDVVVCGGMGAGKTAVLRALTNEVPSARRLVRA
jgi:type IV secretory pathway ATPase VirB11/archaellum biosynthesis ATPase